MPKETTETRSQRLLSRQGNLSAEEMSNLEESRQIIAMRSGTALKIALELRRTAEQMQQEANRLLALADTIAATVEQQQQHADQETALLDLEAVGGGPASGRE